MNWRQHIRPDGTKNNWAIESEYFYIAKIISGEETKYMLTRKTGQKILGWFESSDAAKTEAERLLND